MEPCAFWCVIAAKFRDAFGQMAGSPQRFKEYAAECLRLAQATADNAQKARLLEMAEAWQRLAEASSKSQES